MTARLYRTDSLNLDQLASALDTEPRLAASAILAAAGEGQPEAQLLLGQILLDGRGIERDPVLARHWFVIAARHGSMMAHNMAGRCHEHGWGGDVDLQRAARHYRIAADAGLDWAQYNLANLLATGRGVPPEPERAFALYHQAATAGHAKSMNLVGRFYEEGLVVPRDLAAAHDWYGRSAEAGDFRGQFSYAGVLAERGHIDKACEWLEKALVQGNLNFLRVSRQQLLRARQADIKAMAIHYFSRAAEIGDASDRQALTDLPELWMQAAV